MERPKQIAIISLATLGIGGLLLPIQSAIVAQQAGKRPPIKATAKGPQTQITQPGDPESTATTTETDPTVPTSGFAFDSDASTGTVTALQGGGSLVVQAQVSVTEGYGGFSYVWAVRLTDPNGDDLGTQYYDDHTWTPAAGQAVDMSLSATFADPGTGSKVTARLFRYNADTAATVHAGISAATDRYAAATLNLPVPFQE